MKKLSVVLATRNEEVNIARCLESVKNLAHEMIVFDEGSTDKTAEIAKSFGAKVYNTKHEPIFHITKQKAIDKASGDWILQLDADEVVSKPLAQEIKLVLQGNEPNPNHKKEPLFKRHQGVVEQRDGPIGVRKGEVAAYFIPRMNFFLGKPLIHAGVYPDAVIRLIKKGKAYLPGKSVHEQMVVKGRVAWLYSDLEHHDSPTLKRYFVRMNRYTDLRAKEYQKNKINKNIQNLFFYSTFKPLMLFLKLYLRHRGYKDGLRGFLWSFLSALHIPLSYYKYWTAKT